MVTIKIPGSKSITQRALVCAALGDGISIIRNPLFSEDTLLLIDALKSFGIKIENNDSFLKVYGNRGNFPDNGKLSLFMGNNGTGVRFLIPLSGFYKNKVIITADKRMYERPVDNLVDALKDSGFKIKYLKKEGFPPLEIYHVTNLKSKEILINANKSSQFVSALLISSPLFLQKIEQFRIKVTGKIVSHPYIKLTLDIMEQFGIKVQKEEKNGFSFSLRGKYFYKHRDFTVESDFSSASYFIAAALIAKVPVKIENLFFNNSLQGDKQFIDIVKKMGADISIGDSYVIAHNGSLNGIEVDMGDVPDIVPTLSVLSVFAKSPTIIKNIHHLKFKESNRILSIVENLLKTGVKAEAGENFIKIYPLAKDKLKKCIINPANDHRIAMSFALFSLVNNEIEVSNKECVNKSFPGFWNEFDKFKKFQRG